MVIKSLSITNLRSHRLTELNGFEKVVMLVGQNYSGKSTVLDALCYGLRGVCRGTDEGGRNADRLVSADGNGRPLAKTFTVKVETDAGIIERTGPGDGPRSAVQTAVDGLLGRVSTRLVDPRLLIQSTWFFELTPNEQKVVIQQLTAAEVRRQDVAQAIGHDFAMIEHLWPAELQARPLSDIDEIEKYLREQRRAVKKEADFLRPVDLGTYPEAIRKLTVAQAEELEQKIATKLTALKAQHRQQSAGPEVERRRLADLEAQVEALKMQIASKPVANLHDLDKDIASTEAEIAKRVEEIGRFMNRPQQGEDAAARLEQLRAATGKCWVCDRVLDEKRKAVLRARLEKQLKEAADVQGDITRLNREAQKLKAWVDERRQAKADLSAALKANEGAAERLDAALAAVEKQRAVVKDLQPAEEGLEGRIKTGEDRLVEVRTYLQARRLYERQTAEVATVGGRVATLERLCEAFGPKGAIRTGIASTGGVDFAAAVNEVAGPLGLNVAIEPEPFRILARGRDASLLSTSQQLRLGFAMQIAIARITGLGFVCVDNLDWIDQAGRRTISQAVRAIPEQVFVCATLAMPDQDYKAPTLPGWGFYLVSGDGDSSSVRRVG
jgi:DNA repair exonuclease SbcCD ATPase subunit